MASRNPLEVIEQITYLLFLRRLDELQTLADNKANRTGTSIDRVIFDGGTSDPRRWKNFKQTDPASMYAIVSEQVFPFLRGLGGEDSTYSHHMRDARFTIPTPALLSRVVDMLDDIPMTDRDTNGDLYEYMLGKIATAGQNGQFRTPRHIIALMVEMTAPKPKDDICDPACGTAGFLVAASEYLRREYPNLLMDAEASKGTKPAVIRSIAGPGDVRLLQIDDLRPGAVLKFAPPTPRGAVAAPTDVVLAWDGANAGTSAFGLSGMAGSTLAVLRPIDSSRLSTPYLGHFIRAQQRYLRDHCKGATVPHIDPRVLGELDLVLQPIEEQCRIADILDRADALRARRREALALLDDLTQSIYLDMFGDPNVTRTRLPVQTIGQMLTSAQYGTSARAGNVGRFPILRMGNVTSDGKIDIRDLKYIDLDVKDEARYLVNTGDVLFNRTNSADLVGKTAVYRKHEPVAFAGYLVRLRVNANNRPEYLAAFLNSVYGKRVLRGMAKSIVGMANINAKEVQRIKIGVPALTNQAAFADRVRAIEHKRDSYHASALELDALFASLQQRAFQGEEL